MTTRSMPAAFAGRSVAMRRMRRRVASASRLYCRTNGCTSYLELDPRTGTASCAICGYTRRIA